MNHYPIAHPQQQGYKSTVHRFFHLYFKGGRYDDQHGLPLAALPALAKIERLVRAVARDLFFDGNEERKRVSAGFDDTFIPAITHLYGGGSVDCDVSWSPPRVVETPNTLKPHVQKLWKS